MITPPADDLAARGTVLFCRRLNEAKDETAKPAVVKVEAVPKPDSFRIDCFTVFASAARSSTTPTAARL